MKIGEKIKSLRVKNNLTQEELADRCELSKGFISQVERELTSPSIATLIDILDSLGTNLRDFFNESFDEKIVFTQDDVFIKTNDSLRNQISWIVPNSQKNAMEPIRMELDISGCSETHNPHEGEEFGYVLSGSIYLNLASEKLRVKRGESFYFKPAVPHSISNAGKKKACVLWVSTPPSF